jgi:putative hydrolase of the HAD superfamily
MRIRGILFDLYGTLIDIHTDEGCEEIYRTISHFMSYQGIQLNSWEVREEYFRIMEEQRRAGAEQHPEFRAVEVWKELVRRNRGISGTLSPGKLEQMPLFLAELYRGISRRRLELYPDVKTVLDHLGSRYRLGVISDGQSVWALPEMRVLGIQSHFNAIIVSSDYGFRKPDRRLFEAGLSCLRLKPGQVIFVGNDMYRDIFGAGRIGMKTVFFSSNQGQKEMTGMHPDYVIHQFAELPQAVRFFKRR